MSVKRRELIRCLVLLCALIFMPPDAKPWPIEPVPLRKLWSTADVVIVGRVISVAQVSADAKHSDIPFHYEGHYDRAKILVEQSLKGTAAPRTNVFVGFNKNMGCPAPPKYEVGQDVLAFLKTGKDDVMHTVGLSYGAKDASDRNRIKAYIDAIGRLEPILKESDWRSRNRLMTEWLVQCAEQPYLRWDGAYELWAGAIEPLPNVPAVSAGYLSALTRDQKDRLVRSLIKKLDLQDEGVNMLVEFVNLLGDTRIIQPLFREFQLGREELMRLPDDTVDMPLQHPVFQAMDALAVSLAWEEGREIVYGVYGTIDRTTMLKLTDVFLANKPAKRLTTKPPKKGLKQMVELMTSPRKARMIEKIEKALVNYLGDSEPPFNKKGAGETDEIRIVIKNFTMENDFGASILLENTGKLYTVWIRDPNSPSRIIHPPELNQYRVMAVTSGTKEMRAREISQIRNDGFKRRIHLVAK